jgi:hypothetical protein
MERKKSCTYRDWNSDPSAVKPVASRYTDCSLPAPIYRLAQKLLSRPLYCIIILFFYFIIIYVYVSINVILTFKLFTLNVQIDYFLN